MKENEENATYIYWSKRIVSFAFFLYNVSSNVQRLKDFHHFFFAFHSLLLFYFASLLCYCLFSLGAVSIVIENIIVGFTNGSGSGTLLL